MVHLTYNESFRLTTCVLQIPVLLLTYYYYFFAHTSTKP